MIKFLLVLSILSFGISAQAKTKDEENDSMRVVGAYFPYWRSVDSVDFNGYTHLYYAFVFCDSVGGLQFPNYSADSLFHVFLDVSAETSAKKLISINTHGMSRMARDSIARDRFADTLIQFCKFHHLDGIDMDWEGIQNKEDQNNYTHLVKTMRQKIDADSSNLIFTITVGYGNYWMQWFDNEALDQGDFLQIMIYDRTGTWENSPFGNHSSLQHVHEAYIYWTSRGYKPKDLVFGVPYYGYCFKDSTGGVAEAHSYTEVMKRFPDAKSNENYFSDSSGHYFIMSEDLLQQKLDFLKMNKFKGVFVWEMAQDDPFSKKSLHRKLMKALFRSSNRKD